MLLHGLHDGVLGITYVTVSLPNVAVTVKVGDLVISKFAAAGAARRPLPLQSGASRRVFQQAKATARDSHYLVPYVINNFRPLPQVLRLPMGIFVLDLLIHPPEYRSDFCRIVS